jgi:vancomycin permeability regulator SanA
MRKVVVVTQGFHMARALWDARRAGLHATGYSADRPRYGRRSWGPGAPPQKH